MILEQAAALKDAVPIILHHHERYAGHGYPYGLRANEIPLGARIVAIADAYDAMVHDRPYKRAISHEQAIDELRRHAGTQFDPELVELFCDLYATHAPEPDATVTALNAAGDAHAAAGNGPLVLPSGSAARSDRRRRRSDLRPADGPTEPTKPRAVAADGDRPEDTAIAPKPARATPRAPRGRTPVGVADRRVRPARGAVGVLADDGAGWRARDRPVDHDASARRRQPDRHAAADIAVRVAPLRGRLTARLVSRRPSGPPAHVVARHPASR